jgi:hypothetical protein
MIIYCQPDVLCEMCGKRHVLDIAQLQVLRAGVAKNSLADPRSWRLFCLFFHASKVVKSNKSVWSPFTETEMLFLRRVEERATRKKGYPFLVAFENKVENLITINLTAYQFLKTKGIQ